MSASIAPDRTCRFCEHGDMRKMQCRRNPPVVNPNGGGGLFPTIGPDDWCGEFSLSISSLFPVSARRAAREVLKKA